MTTLAMMNHKRREYARILGVAFVAIILIALFGSKAAAPQGKGRRGFSHASAPLLSSSRIADTKSFHRRSFSAPVAASEEPLFRNPADLAHQVSATGLALSGSHGADARDSHQR